MARWIYWAIGWSAVALAIILPTAINSDYPITIGGSTSTFPLLEQLTKFYNNNTDTREIMFSSSGSSAGLNGAQTGYYELGFTSFALDPKNDLNKLTAGYEFATDRIAMIYHLPENSPALSTPLNFVGKQNHNVNTAKAITIALSRLYVTGSNAITNWSKINGVDAPVTVYGRENGSGTRQTVQNKIGSTPINNDKYVVTSNGEMLRQVEATPGAIGYISYNYIENNPSSNYKVGTFDQAKPTDDHYDFSRPFSFVYSEKNVSTPTKIFAKWITNQSEDQSVSPAFNNEVKLPEALKLNKNPVTSFLNTLGLSPGVKALLPAKQGGQ